jgi:hypothetical protein
MILILAINGCTGGQTAPPPNIEATVAAAIAATQTAQPTNTALPAPTDTSTPEPTATPIPTDTPTPEPTATPTAQASIIESTVLDSGWIRYEDAADKFAIALPPVWQPLNLNAVALEDALGVVGEQMPEFGQLFSNQLLRNLVASGIKFYALDLSPESVAAGIPASINILRTDLGVEFPLDSYVALNVRQVEGIADPAVPLVHQRVTLGEGGVEAEELQYQMNLPSASGEPTPATLLQYLIIDKSIVYVITISTPPEVAEANLPLMKEIAQTLELLP